ncbi:MAG TPA: caspase family protein [Roseomonas sp.]|jgi:hypothetical protein
MLLAPDDPLREDGLVYLDQALAQMPATHVLIVGIGDYRSGRLSPLTSPTVSAREFSSWFTDLARGRFRHPACPLGSVAVVLSEPGANPSMVGGGPVPRGTFAEVRRAMRSWLNRINSHKDNLAFLYVACHGESSRNQTGILLEDFDSDAMDATAGMSEVGQLVGSLENATAVQQLLLFDCCRTPTNLDLPFDTQFGTPLLVLKKPLGDHGETRRQWLIFATSQGEEATGRKNRTTLFADALIQCLNGAAADPADDDWPVRPGLLIDRLTRLLALHRLPGERLQAPSGRVTSSFTITHPGEPKEVPIYFSCENAALWKDASIILSPEHGSELSVRPQPNDPFAVARLPPLTKLMAKMVSTTEMQPVALTLRGSAAFVEFRQRSAVTSVVVPGGIADLPAGKAVRRPGAVDPPFNFDLEVKRLVLQGRSHPVLPVLVVFVRGPYSTAPSVSLEILSTDSGSKSVKKHVSAFNTASEFMLRSGEYVVTARAPGADPRSEQVVVQEGRRVTVEFKFPTPPHKWLVAATIMGLIDIDVPAKSSTKLLGVAVNGRGQEMRLDLSKDAGVGTPFDVREAIADARFRRLDIKVARRRREDPVFQRPLFLSVRSGDRAELAVVPHTPETLRGDQAWSVHLLLQHSSEQHAPLAHVVVESDRWMSLLGFLTKRDFVSAKAVLEASEYLEALERKLANPIAATAAALVAVGLADPAADKLWDPWLHNLSNWFPCLPDGPIILGRRLLTRARSAKQVAEARRWLLMGFDRGAPFFSLSADWLARSLESLPGSDAELMERRVTARRFAQLVDPQQPFTVIRVR